MKPLVSHLLMLLVGVGVGALLLPRAAPPAPAGVPRQEPSRPDARALLVAATALPDGEALRRDVGQIVREELRAFVAQSSGAARTTTTAAPNEPEPQNDEMRGRALALVQAATGKRTWTKDDASALHQLMPQLTADQRQEVVQTLLPLLNSGNIRVDTRAPF